METGDGYKHRHRIILLSIFLSFRLLFFHLGRLPPDYHSSHTLFLKGRSWWKRANSSNNQPASRSFEKSHLDHGYNEDEEVFHSQVEIL